MPSRPCGSSPPARCRCMALRDGTAGAERRHDTREKGSACQESAQAAGSASNTRQHRSGSARNAGSGSSAGSSQVIRTPGVHLGGHLTGLAVILREKVGHSTADPRHPEQPRLGCSRLSSGVNPVMIDRRENCPGRMEEKTNDIQRRWFQEWRLLGPVQGSPALHRWCLRWMPTRQRWPRLRGIRGRRAKKGRIQLGWQMRRGAKFTCVLRALWVLI
ncbi:hypothetical protein AB205_0170200 [Aquarana catesbeiana]|uniref:Uncharacterized protein n=1 Tax=Aquarana catesbeiana TaxID=8400 RepID=A0A2G9QG54_AQUCT|nr:hypothetical protein AB205_0170200 [Aquarana catesbeiana]